MSCCLEGSDGGETVGANMDEEDARLEMREASCGSTGEPQGCLWRQYQLPSWRHEAQVTGSSGRGAQEILGSVDGLEVVGGVGL